MLRIGLLTVWLCAVDAVASAVGPVVVSNVYENLDADRAIENVPVTFSRIGAEGDFVSGITPRIKGKKLPAQVDVLRRASDGGKPPVQPDHAHAPSLGYVAYLLTGDEFYAEEASFWASFQLGEWPHKGLRWEGMDRAFAYGLRHVVDAAFVLPDGHPLLPYFTWGVNDCMDQMTERLVKSGRRVHSPIGGVFRCSGRTDWVNAKRCSAWQIPTYTGAVSARRWVRAYRSALHPPQKQYDG